MHWRPLSLIAAAAITVGLAGCASHSEAPPPPPPPAPAPAAPPPAPPPMTMMQQVQAVQTALNSNGAHLTVDGHMGAKTRSALMAFQRSHHLAVTGHADPATLKALGLAG